MFGGVLSIRIGLLHKKNTWDQGGRALQIISADDGVCDAQEPDQRAEGEKGVLTIMQAFYGCALMLDKENIKVCKVVHASS